MGLFDKDYKYENDYVLKGKLITIKMEVNGNFILKENKYFLSERHFFKSYVDDRFKEDFEIIYFDIVNDKRNLVLKKDNVVLRCSW